MHSSRGPTEHRTTWRRRAIAIGALLACPAHAVEIDTGNAELAVRWDNTDKAGIGIRLHDADPTLADSFNAAGFPQALNLNAGDQNFRKRGLYSERLDLL